MKKEVVITILFCFLTAALWAQLQPQQVAQMMAENYAKLRQYSWNTRTEVQLKGQQLSVSVEKIRYDLDGKLQVTPLGGSGKIGPELQPVVNELARLGWSYAQPDPNRFVQFFRNSEIWESKSGTVRIEGENFLKNGDQIDLRGKNQRPDRLEVDTIYGNRTPVEIDADFRALSNGGPNFVARLEVSVPSDGLLIIVENFDHTFSSAVSATDITKIAEGTEILIRLSAPLSSKQAKPSQGFQAILDKDIVVKGTAALKAGTPVTGVVVDVKAAGRAQSKGAMSIQLSSIETSGGAVPIETNLLKFEAEGTGRKTGRRLAGGTGLGAAIGAIADGGSGAWKGAAIGAGIGVGATLLTKGNEVEFPAEQLLSFTLTKTVEIGR
jgi:hypothetical protein